MSALPARPLSSNPFLRFFDLVGLAHAISLHVEARRLPRALIDRLVGPTS